MWAGQTFFSDSMGGGGAVNEEPVVPIWLNLPAGLAPCLGFTHKKFRRVGRGHLETDPGSTHGGSIIGCREIEIMLEALKSILYSELSFLRRRPGVCRTFRIVLIRIVGSSILL